MTRRSSRSARRALTEAGSNPADGAASASGSRRRRSSGGSARSRGASASASAEPRGARRPPIGRDGKASIACPNCAARYKIPEEHLENKVECTQCHRTFFPLAAANSRHRAPDHTKPIIYGIVAVVAIIVVGLIINSASKPAEVIASPVPEKKVVNLGSDSAEASAVLEWAKAVHEKDEFNALRGSFMDEIQKKYGIDKKSPYSQSFGDAKEALGKKILARLFDSDESLVFRFYDPRAGRIVDEAMVAAKKGTVRLRLAAVDPKLHNESAVVMVDYEFNPAVDRFQVTGWYVETMARASYLLEESGKQPGKKHQKHKIIGEVTRRKITFGGKELEVTEAELVPLPHLETTSPEDRKTIDLLIDDILDLSASGMKYNRASNKLVEFGKAAVPRVLNKMYETKMKTRDDIDCMNRLCRVLRNMTGERFGFNHVDMPEGTDIGGTEKERIASLKRWYAWWARYHDRDDWRNVDNDEEVEMTTKEIEANRKKKAEDLRKERLERRNRAKGFEKKK